MLVTVNHPSHGNARSRSFIQMPPDPLNIFFDCFHKSCISRSGLAKLWHRKEYFQAIRKNSIFGMPRLDTTLQKLCPVPDVLQLLANQGCLDFIKHIVGQAASSCFQGLDYTMVYVDIDLGASWAFKDKIELWCLRPHPVIRLFELAPLLSAVVRHTFSSL